MSISRATRQFFMSTTLHGFKYLCSSFHSDRRSDRELKSSTYSSPYKQTEVAVGRPYQPKNITAGVNEFLCGDHESASTRWSDDLRKVAGKSWMRVSEDRAQWRAIGEAYVQHICWLSWCVASACCAGTLCAVLWARFLQVPALLTLNSAMTAPLPLPTVAVCLPSHNVAWLLVSQLLSWCGVVSPCCGRAYNNYNKLRRWPTSIERFLAAGEATHFLAVVVWSRHAVAAFNPVLWTLKLTRLIMLVAPPYPLRNQVTPGEIHPLRLVAPPWCPSDRISKDKAVVRRLTHTFTRILEGKETERDNLVLLEQLLDANNVTVLEALYSSMPPCYRLTTLCRWQNTVMPCEDLFHWELTQFGVCCVMQPSRMNNLKKESAWDSIKQLELVLRCSNKTFFYGCRATSPPVASVGSCLHTLLTPGFNQVVRPSRWTTYAALADPRSTFGNFSVPTAICSPCCMFFTQYQGEESMNSVVLTPGLEYLAQLTYQTVRERSDDQIIAGTCVSGEYSQTECVVKCMERRCGCSNPLRTVFQEETNVPPPCTLSQLNCLRHIDNSSCVCMPSCGKLTTELYLEDNRLESVEHTVDPLYSGLNVSEVTVVHLQVLVDGSRIFTKLPTQTWFTLLSSLGGVFNMFLGVGLFSALELIFFLMVRIPTAITHYPEMDLPTRTPVQDFHYRTKNTFGANRVYRNKNFNVEM
ncbi:hypothetical protein MSG28_001344 [Choristoneura fumiferana]|uniref:Uncharacterized protein n=1 Tax=Choristoneura fumiferana TaxID=7141 RepID=A0ACC0KTQ4_CHOFU|nr:hypothetical protein MSG28_001344 [Choristoneura fumiferana]